MAGLSGGSWALGGLAQSNFQNIPEIFFGPSTNVSASSDASGNGLWGGWNAAIDIFPTNITYDIGLVEDLAGKLLQFPISFTDLWALALSRHFMNGTTAENFFDDSASLHGVSVLFSDIPNL